MRILAALNQIKDNRYQARVEYGDLDELAADIQRQAAARPDTMGLQQVPSARLIGDDGGWVPMAGLAPDDFLDEKRRLCKGWAVELEFGHRRKRAFEHLSAGGAYEYGLMPLDLRDLTDDQMLDGVWQENRSRRDLSSVEEAELLARKVAQVGNQRLAAEAWGIARATVANKLALLELPEEIRQANRDGRLSERAALSLASVVQIQQRAYKDTKWGKTQEHWGPPLAPAAFIEQAINDPKMTSDTIRDYTKRALQHAGVPLPQIIADMNAPQGGAIVRASCSGCPGRINTTCLTPECLTAKIEAFKMQMIADAETVLAIPFSDHEDDFVFASWEEKKALHELWNAGQQRVGTNFVFGWRTNEAALRPFKNNELKFVHMNEVLDGDGRAAIAIGHRGNLPLHLLSSTSVLPARQGMPDAATRQVWEKEAKKLMKQALQQAQESLWESLDMRLDDAVLDIMQALVSRPDADWQYERDAQIKLTLTHLLQYGDGAVRFINDVRDLDRMRTLLNRAGLDATAVLTTGTRSTDLRRQGILALHYYWCTGNYNRHYGQDVSRAHLVGAINAFDAAAPFAQTDEEYATLHTELKRALRYLDASAAENG